MRQDDEQRPRETGLGQARLQAAQIGLNHRTHRGIRDGGREAFELLDLRQHLGRGGDVGVLQPLARNGGSRLLVFRILPGMQEADRHRLDILGSKPI